MVRKYLPVDTYIYLFVSTCMYMFVYYVALLFTYMPVQCVINQSVYFFPVTIVLSLYSFVHTDSDSAVLDILQCYCDCFYIKYNTTSIHILL